MNLKGLREQLREEPFRPFKIVTSDGRELLIRHPELVHIAEGGIVYVFEPSEREPAEVKLSPKKISAMHITMLEPIEAGSDS